MSLFSRLLTRDIQHFLAFSRAFISENKNIVTVFDCLSQEHGWLEIII